LKNLNDPDEIIVLFDIDAIPLNKKIIPLAVDWAKNNIGLFGNAQVAPNLKSPHNKFIYAAPSFLVFSIKTYNELGRPSFNTTQRSDCGGELSHIAKEKELPVNLLLPNHAEMVNFDLDEQHSFGYGTTYSNNTYHAFESSRSESICGNGDHRENRGGIARTRSRHRGTIPSAHRLSRCADVDRCEETLLSPDAVSEETKGSICGSDLVQIWYVILHKTESRVQFKGAFRPIIVSVSSGNYQQNDSSS
jgi:hypothetical protein